MNLFITSTEHSSVRHDEAGNHSPNPAQHANDRRTNPAVCRPRRRASSRDRQATKSNTTDCQHEHDGKMRAAAVNPLPE